MLRAWQDALTMPYTHSMRKHIQVAHFKEGRGCGLCEAVSFEALWVAEGIPQVTSVVGKLRLAVRRPQHRMVPRMLQISEVTGFVLAK